MADGAVDTEKNPSMLQRAGDSLVLYTVGLLLEIAVRVLRLGKSMR